jgi:hypothetical protein
MKDVTYRVGACTGCAVKWLMNVIGRNQGDKPLCPQCHAPIVQVPPRKV